MGKKSKFLAFLFCLFFGVFGVHKFYLGKKKIGILYLCTLGIFGIGWFVDIFTIGKQVDKANGISGNTSSNQSNDNRGNKQKRDKKQRNESKSSVDEYLEKKNRGHYSSYGNIKVLGGMLPNSGSIGNIKVYYDEEFPKNSGSHGSQTIYKASGHLQVFYSPKDYPDFSQKYQFIGKSVDIYQK